MLYQAVPDLDLVMAVTDWIHRGLLRLDLVENVLTVRHSHLLFHLPTLLRRRRFIFRGGMDTVEVE
jgi:hypothetical protein